MTREEKTAKRAPMTTSERMKKMLERKKERAKKLDDAGFVEIPLIITKAQRDKIDRYAELTRILPGAEGDGLKSGEFLFRLTQPALRRFEQRFDELAEKNSELYEDIKLLRDFSPHYSDRQFKLSREGENLWHRYVAETDPEKAAALLVKFHEKSDEIIKLMNTEPSDQKGKGE